MCMQKPKKDKSNSMFSNCDLELRTKAAGTYVCCTYNEAWPDISKAYAELVRFAEEQSLVLDDIFYETSLFRFFDESEDTLYQCTISARVVRHQEKAAKTHKDVHGEGDINVT